MVAVLVIDDDLSTREGFLGVLTRERFQVATAATGREGFHLALSRQFDLILAKLCLPDLSGLEVLTRTIREGADFGIRVR